MSFSSPSSWHVILTILASSFSVMLNSPSYNSINFASINSPSSLLRAAQSGSTSPSRSPSGPDCSSPSSPSSELEPLSLLESLVGFFGPGAAAKLWLPSGPLGLEKTSSLRSSSFCLGASQCLWRTSAWNGSSVYALIWMSQISFLLFSPSLWIHHLI